MRLAFVTADHLEGVYGSTKDVLPERMRYLHPDAARSVRRMAKDGKRGRASDVFRSPESSLQAAAEKRGVQPPGYSAHNFGVAVDFDVAVLMSRWKLSKVALDGLMDSYGWVCHRQDHQMGSESWHYNFLGEPDTDEGKRYRALVRTSSAPAVEQRIVDLYGPTLTLDAVGVQTALRELRMYSGELDGALGKLSQQAVMAFQRAWHLPVTGLADAKTQRTLAVVTAKREVVQLEAA